MRIRASIKNLYFKDRFFYGLGVLVLLFVLSYIKPNLFWITRLLFFVFAFLVVYDLVLLFLTKGKLKAHRDLPEKLSNGDLNPIQIKLTSTYRFKVFLKVIDEVPFQFQKRDFGMDAQLLPGNHTTLDYGLKPTERGEYSFGSLNVFVSSILQLVSRRYRYDQGKEIKVYPSFLQLRKYDLLAFNRRLHEYGLKKIRRIGHTMEFEQIKEYVKGDDFRNINWKATAKKSQLMVNQYQDEKAQPIYCAIDKGRVMKMPFENLKLLDYAINATLVLSNIAIKKSDKAGMFAFSSQVENYVVAERRNKQMNLILETLYKMDTDFRESDFSRLYVSIKRNISQRSLIFLFTNFETLDALHRQLPYLKALAKNHLLVTIFFENSELGAFVRQPAKNTLQIFEQTIAEKFIYEKKLIVRELTKHGIQAILTQPQNLTVNAINKYLELKARGSI